MVLRVLGLAIGAALFFSLLLEGFHLCVVEIGGASMANHSLEFCVNWLLGLVTGGLFVCLLWCAGSIVRKKRS